MDLQFLSINGAVKDKENLAEIVGRASELFPRNLWEDVEYLWNVKIDPDVPIEYKKKPYLAFSIEKIKRKMRYLRKILEPPSTLFGITYDPIVVSFSGFENGVYMNLYGLVREDFYGDIGFFSLFDTEEEKSHPLIAHGLGHSFGLDHHTKPIGIMYDRISSVHSEGLEEFCPDCTRFLEDGRDYEDLITSFPLSVSFRLFSWPSLHLYRTLRNRMRGLLRDDTQERPQSYQSGAT